MPASTTQTVKMSIVLDSTGGIVGVSKPREYRPAKEGDEPVVTANLTARPGQSMAEIEVPAGFVDLNASELLSRLAQEASVQTVIASLPTAGAAPTAGGTTLTASPRLVSSQGLPTGAVTAGSI